MGSVETSLYFMKDYYNEIESSLKNNTDLDIKKITENLCSFCFSETLIPFIINETCSLFQNVLSIFEMKEKFLSLKIIFQLLEELKKKNFENYIIPLIQGKDKISNIEQQFKKNHQDSINKFSQSENYRLISSEINSYIEKHSSYLQDLFRFNYFIVVSTFLGIFQLIFPEQKITFYEVYDSFFKKDSNNFFNDENINAMINIINQMSSLKNIKDALQNSLFFLNLKKNEKEISLIEQIDEKFFENYEGAFSINDKIKWKFYEENLNESNTDNKYKKTILEGKMTEKEKYNFDIFKNINIAKIKTDLKGINGSIFKSIFYGKEILLIQINVEYYKNKILNLEEFQNEIQLIKKSCPEKYHNLDTYAQIENKIISLDSSYELLIKELKERKIIIEQKIIEKNENINNKEIEGLTKQLNEEKEKNKKLEKELLEERNKNKEKENIIINLKKDLDNEIKKNKESQKEAEEAEKASSINLTNETKDSLIETIIEKEKEIKELKLKLSRFPFVVEEGEKLMSVNFVSTDKKLISSIICKNTDEFNKIESQLYKNHPEYFKNEISFTFNGKKIKGFKTLEQNGIKNDDIIIMKEIED